MRDPKVMYLLAKLNIMSVPESAPSHVSQGFRSVALTPNLCAIQKI